MLCDSVGTYLIALVPRPSTTPNLFPRPWQKTLLVFVTQRRRTIERNHRKLQELGLVGRAEVGCPSAEYDTVPLPITPGTLSGHTNIRLCREVLVASPTVVVTRGTRACCERGRRARWGILNSQPQVLARSGSK